MCSLFGEVMAAFFDLSCPTPQSRVLVQLDINAYDADEVDNFHSNAVIAGGLHDPGPFLAYGSADFTI